MSVAGIEEGEPQLSVLGDSERNRARSQANCHSKARVRKGIKHKVKSTKRLVSVSVDISLPAHNFAACSNVITLPAHSRARAATAHTATCFGDGCPSWDMAELVGDAS